MGYEPWAKLLVALRAKFVFASCDCGRNRFLVLQFLDLGRHPFWSQRIPFVRFCGFFSSFFFGGVRAGFVLKFRTPHCRWLVFVWFPSQINQSRFPQKADTHMSVSCFEDTPLPWVQSSTKKEAARFYWGVHIRESTPRSREVDGLVVVRPVDPFGCTRLPRPCGAGSGEQTLAMAEKVWDVPGVLLICIYIYIYMYIYYIIYMVQ